jgi:hypothetical protein
MTDGGMNDIRIEPRAAQAIEIGNQARGRWNAHLEIFFAGDALVNSGTDASPFTERTA